uniref:Uncharacterized protein n=1 Tax=Ananas comosus var. bracteatus TaxID=296719 RepID=A0A6V7NX92_ANACO|nr:unnamed protein product [Ananas comosus var. bracteatus]
MVFKTYDEELPEFAHPDFYNDMVEQYWLDMWWLSATEQNRQRDEKETLSDEAWKIEGDDIRHLTHDHTYKMFVNLERHQEEIKELEIEKIRQILWELHYQDNIRTDIWRLFEESLDDIRSDICRLFYLSHL